MSRKLAVLKIISYFTAGMMLLILLYDLQVGNIVPGVPVSQTTPTLPPRSYILVLPAQVHLMYKALKGENLWQI